LALQRVLLTPARHSSRLSSGQTTQSQLPPGVCSTTRRTMVRPSEAIPHADRISSEVHLICMPVLSLANAPGIG
jgi:hypothetical protein